jgi:P-type Cu+ transporter
VLVGRWIEARVRRKTMAAVHHLVALQPPEVRRLTAGGAEEMVPLAEIAVGETIVVWMGERVPLDGDVSDGLGTFDYALLTGETAPRVLGKGESVVAGALCLNGSIKFKVTNHAGQTMLDRLADMVAVAQASHPELQRLVDRVAGYFIAVVLAFAALTVAFWAAQNDWATAEQAGIAVLLLACPCALGLAVPMVIAVAVGQAAKHGIILRDATALERAAKVTTVIFDKTGTLSMGEPELAETVTFGAQSSDQILAYAAALNQKVNHPVAVALRRIVAQRSLPLDLPTLAGNPAIVYGRGVQGTLADGTELICGNLSYMSEHKVPLQDAAATAAGWEERGRILSWLAVLKPAPRLLGLMSFRDYIRPEAQAAVTALQQQNYNLSLVSGDNRHSTISVAKRLGIGHMIGEAMPQDKMQEIQKRQKWGEIVAMVGDGMNDAPALAIADLGIAMHGGVSAADAAAPVRLLRDDLRLVPAVLDLAKAARRVMLMNLGWAVLFNLVGLPLAAAGMLPPALAVVSMSVSSLAVIANALTLKNWRPDV